MLKRLFSNNSSSSISLLFISLMFLLPFVNIYHQLPVISFYSEWIAAILGLAALTPMLKNVAIPNLQIPQISLGFLGLILILCIQWALGMLHSSQYALLILSYLIWAFLLSLLGSQLRRELGWNKMAITLAFFLVIAGIINGGILVLQIVTRTGGTIPFLPFLDAYGPFSQENHFANFTALATASLIYLYAKGRFSTGFFTLILVWFLLMLAVSGSRSSWLYLITFITLAFVVQKQAIKQCKNSTATKYLLYACLTALPLFALIHVLTQQVAPPGLFSLTIDRIVNGIQINTPSARLQIWYDSLRMFWQSPWLGIGTGEMIAKSFLLLDNPSAMAYKGMFEHSHNLFIHLMTEMGIGAFLIVVTSLAIWIRQLQWQELNPELWWLISLVAILGIHSMLEYPLWYAYFLGVAAILLGAGDEKIITFNTSRISGMLTARLIRTGLALVLLLGALNLSTMLLAHIKLTNAIHQTANTNTNKQDLDWVYRYTLLSPYVELMYAISMTIDQKNIDRQILLNQSALNFRPFSKIAYQQVVLLKLKGDSLNAKKLLKRTLMVYPGNLKSALKSIPKEYHKDFLEILDEVDPVLSKQIITN